MTAKNKFSKKEKLEKAKALLEELKQLQLSDEELQEISAGRLSDYRDARMQEYLDAQNDPKKK